MFTVSQVAKHLGTTGTTIRNYAGEFSEFLSPAATPGPGKPRQFDEDDLAVLSTVAVLRGQLASPEAIVAALRAGQRLEPARPAAPEDAHDIAAVDAFTLTLQVFESRLDKAESRLDEERQARLAAELRAVAAETELKILREAHTADPPAPMTFREWWNSRRRPG